MFAVSLKHFLITTVFTCLHHLPTASKDRRKVILPCITLVGFLLGNFKTIQKDCFYIINHSQIVEYNLLQLHHLLFASTSN